MKVTDINTSNDCSHKSESGLERQKAKENLAQVTQMFDSSHNLDVRDNKMRLGVQQNDAAGELISSSNGEYPLPESHGEAQEFDVFDKDGEKLILRIEDGSPEKLKEALARESTYFEHAVRMNIYQKGKSIGYARLGVKVQEQFNTNNNQYEQDIAVKLRDISVNEDQRGKNIGALLLRRTETIAHEVGAREVYGFPESDNARAFFEHNGYQTRFKENGAPEIFKTL